MNHQGLNNLRKFIGPSILILAGSFMLRLSWFKWPDLLIDYGRELYVPWQITQGKVLYADINHLYGPLAHYMNAFLFQIFGTGLSTLAYFNIGLVVLLTFIIYHLFKSAFGDVVATTAGICFLVIFAFSQFTGIANYNFVCPYSHEITYGVFLFFLALLVFKKYLTEPKPAYAAAIGLILGLIFLTKVEIFLAAFGSFLCGLIFIFFRLKPHHPKKHLFYLIFFFFLPIIAFFAYFSLHMPVMDAFHSIIASYTNIFIGAEVNNIFYLRISGLDNPARNMMLMLGETFGYFILFIFAGLISYLFAHITNRILRYAGAGVIFALTFLILFFKFFSIHWMEIARAYPVLLALLLAYLVINLIRKREDKTFAARYLPFILLTVFSLLLLLKMILNVRLYHYGFALAMPASLVIAALLLYYIPLWISRLGNKTVAMSFTGLFIFFALLFYFNLTKHIYDLKTCPVAEGRDRFLTFDARSGNHGPIVNETLRYIDQSMAPNDTFIVIPDGVMLNYLSRRENPSRYFEFTPNFVEAMGEDKILNDISLKPPSFIILSEKDSSEHGARYFGKDYAHNIYSWIVRNYDKEILLGSEPLTGNGFGIIIAKKKNKSSLFKQEKHKP
ncbi:MAG: hypothetical protein CVU55_03200 [Deltaproteobacteria bacterium HGW-Deltaproteobacteria-13]|jgi:hypothetical protein|nr:MAG: hypothetical protein CVU55_03200 [Deltaproteobacteria bacterium HGW-Deltaproteobacteria-13]